MEGQTMGSEKRNKRTYDDAFKLEAVRLLDEGMKASQIERDLDITNGLVKKWKKAFEEDKLHPFPGSGYQRPEQAELTRLRREVAVLKREREILKKATAFFAKNQ